MEALKEIQLRFYQDFPPHPNEEVYGFATPSTMKPTQWSYPGGGLNQIPAESTVCGDVRLTPFYSVTDAIKKLQEYVENLNSNIEKLDTRGPVSKYVLPDENLRGRMNITFDEAMSGVACKLESRGFHVLCKATEEVVGHVKQYSITGSLPLIRELKDEGFDVQTTGYVPWLMSPNWNDVSKTMSRVDEDDSWEVRAFEEDMTAGNSLGCTWPPRSYTCTFCRREFRSAQALGGHMNVHRRDRARLHHYAPPPPFPSATASSPALLIQAGQEFLANGLCVLYPLSNNINRNINTLIPTAPSLGLTSGFLPVMSKPNCDAIPLTAPNSAVSSVSNSKNDDNYNKDESSKEVSAVEEIDLELRLGQKPPAPAPP